MIECPDCKSNKIYKVRHDSDWGGTNVMYRANPNECYGSDELQEEYGDINFYACDSCGCEFF